MLGRGGARSEIARLVVTRGQMSKAEIEAVLEFSHPTVINTVGALVANGVLRESGEYDSTGGRKAKVIAPNPAYRYFGGIDITRNHVTEVVVDWTGRAAAKRRRRQAFSPDARYISSVAESFFSFAAEGGFARRKIAGIGVSLPGILSHDRKRLARSHALELRDFDLASFAGRFRGIDVDFENDANAAVQTEVSDLSGDIVYLSLSNTVGGGIASPSSGTWSCIPAAAAATAARRAAPTPISLLCAFRRARPASRTSSRGSKPAMRPRSACGAPISTISPLWSRISAWPSTGPSSSADMSARTWSRTFTS